MVKQKVPKILIGIPSNGFIRIETTVSLLEMLAQTKVEYQTYTPISCYVHMNRDKCAEAALQQGADYLLFIDTDMLFPPDALTKLLALKVDISSVTYNFREYPKKSIVKLDPKYDGEYAVDAGVTERPIPLSAIKKTFRCAAAGTGFMLIKTEVFRKIPRPWFFFEPESAVQGSVGEDVWFCDRARENGFDIWVDPSINMGHIGSTIF